MRATWIRIRFEQSKRESEIHQSRKALKSIKCGAANNQQNALELESFVPARKGGARKRYSVEQREQVAPFWRDGGR